MRQLLLVLLLPPSLLADVVPYAGTTTGAFSAGTPTDLTFSGTTFRGQTADTIACFLLGDCGWALDINLGQFSLSNPSLRNSPDVYDGKTFTLTIDFTSPANVNGGDQHFTAGLAGTIHWYSLLNPMTIDFGGATQHITFGPGADGVGSFDFKVENPSIYLNDTPTLYGDILNAQADPNPVPEPGSVLLLLPIAAGLLTQLRRRAA